MTNIQYMKTAAITVKCNKRTGHVQEKRSFESLIKLLDASLDVICSIDGFGRFVTVSAAAEQVWGYTPDELTGVPYLSLVIEEDKPKTIEAAASIMAGINTTNFQNRYFHKDGSMIPISWSAWWDQETNLMYCVARNATEKLMHERQLKEASDNAKRYAQKLSEILETLGDGFFAMDNNWSVIYFNRKAEQMTGKKREEMLGRNFWEVFPRAKNGIAFEQYSKALRYNVPVSFEIKSKLFNAWYAVNAYPSAEGLSIYFKEISEKKKQEEELRVASERYELVAKATSDAIWDWNIQSGSNYFNETYTHLFGHSCAQNIDNFKWQTHIHSEDKERVLAGLYRALNNPHTVSWQDQYRFRKKDGSWANVLNRSFIMRDSDGTALRMVGSMQDVTAAKTIENELRKLSLVAKETSNAVLITDKEERITWVNQAFTQISEYNFDEVVGKKPADVLQGPGTSARTKQYLRRCIDLKRPFQCEIINYSKSGRPYWIDIKGQPIFNEKGEVEQFFAIQTDVTARKEAEAAIRVSERKYKLLFYKSPRPKWIFDADTYRIFDVNEAATGLYGYTKEEFLQMSMLDIWNQGDARSFCEKLSDFKESKEAHFTEMVRHVKKSGEVFFIEIDSYTLEHPGGRHIIAAGSDMTEKLRLQQNLLEEKVGAQKEVAKAIINTQEQERSEIGKELHDNVNQMITTAKLYIDSIKHQPERQHYLIDKSKEILEKTINEVRVLSKQLVTPAVLEFGLREALEELIEYYRELSLFEITFSIQVDEATIDRGLKITAYRIIQEQINNAVKYAKASLVKIKVVQHHNFLNLVYQDDGVGFDMATSKRGIGISNIKNRADLFKGKVHIESVIGNGCKMRIAFPVREGSLSA